MCYYTNWAQYRPSKWQYFPENVDPNLCTHIIYAFANMINMRLVPFEWNDVSAESKGLIQLNLSLRDFIGLFLNEYTLETDLPSCWVP